MRAKKKKLTHFVFVPAKYKGKFYLKKINVATKILFSWFFTSTSPKRKNANFSSFMISFTNKGKNKKKNVR